MSDDQVTSQKIKEADGTSGQNTNSGSGVKTNHIQNGAVTDAKITGPISASKISSTGLNADTVDGVHATGFATATHNHDGVYQKKYANVVVVAKSGGDYTDPGTAAAFLSSIASPSNPCLLKVMPGIYQIGASTLRVPPYVDLEGSGQDTTFIVGTGDEWQGDPTQLVLFYGQEIRDLTIQHSGDAYSYANYALVTGRDGLSRRIFNVTVRMEAQVNGTRYGINTNSPTQFSNVSIVVGGPGESTGLLLNETTGDDVPSTLANVKISLPNQQYTYGYGIVANASSVIDGLSVQSSSPSNVYGLMCTNGHTTQVRNADIAGRVGNIRGHALAMANSRMLSLDHQNYSDGTVTRVSFSEIDGPIAAVGEGLSCFNLHDGNLAPLTCQ